MSDSPANKDSEEYVATVSITRKSDGKVVNAVRVDRVVKMYTDKSLLQYPHSNGRRIIVPGPISKFVLEGEVYTSAEEFIKYVDENAKPAMTDISVAQVQVPDIKLSPVTIDGIRTFKIEAGK